MKLFNEVALEDNKVDLNKLDIYLPSIAQEGMVNDLIDRIKGVFGTIKDLLTSNSLDNSIKNDVPLTTLITNINKEIEIIKKYPNQNDIPKIIYNLKNALVSVPNGFNGDLEGLIKILLGLSQIVYRAHHGAITKLNTTLSVYVSNKDHRKATETFKKDIVGLQALNAQINKNISKFFEHKAGSSNMLRYTDIVDNYNSFIKEIYEVEKLAKANNFADVLQAHGEITKTIELIDLFIKETSSDSNIEANYIKNISIYTAEVAKTTEALSRVRFTSELAIKLYGNLVNILLKAL